MANSDEKINRILSVVKAAFNANQTGSEWECGCEGYNNIITLINKKNADERFIYCATMNKRADGYYFQPLQKI